MPSGSDFRPRLDLERSLNVTGCTRIAGLDEVGRGSWAGPLVAAAVILPLRDPDLPNLLEHVRDSKQLSRIQREACFQSILSVSLAVGIGWASHHVIDSHGIAEANRRALVRAVAGLGIPADGLVIDHFSLSELSLPQICVPKGDSRSLSVASASIVAKVIRDRWMVSCDGRFPEYGFAQHKGYGTPAHQTSLERLGPCPIHRVSFSPIGSRMK